MKSRLIPLTIFFLSLLLICGCSKGNMDNSKDPETKGETLTQTEEKGEFFDDNSVENSGSEGNPKPSTSASPTHSSVIKTSTTTKATTTTKKPTTTTKMELPYRGGMELPEDIF